MSEAPWDELTPATALARRCTADRRPRCKRRQTRTGLEVASGLLGHQIARRSARLATVREREGALPWPGAPEQSRLLRTPSCERAPHCHHRPKTVFHNRSLKPCIRRDSSVGSPGIISLGTNVAGSWITAATPVGYIIRSPSRLIHQPAAPSNTRSPSVENRHRHCPLRPMVMQWNWPAHVSP
jgi:hypothetical protein